MARYRRSSRKQADDNLVLVVIAVFVGIAILGDARLMQELAPGLLLIAVAVGGVWFYLYSTRRKRALQYASLRAHAVDTMSGMEFEIFLKHLLTARGFSVEHIGKSGDSGVDLKACKDGQLYAIQAKRYSGKVPKSAMYAAVAGREHRRCNHAMVITNSYFTKQGIEFAQETGCILVDRDLLGKWVLELQGNM